MVCLRVVNTEIGRETIETKKKKKKKLGGLIVNFFGCLLLNLSRLDLLIGRGCYNNIGLVGYC